MLHNPFVLVTIYMFIPKYLIHVTFQLQEIEITIFNIKCQELSKK